MTGKEKLIKLHEIVQKFEDQRYEFSHKCMEKNNILGTSIHNAEASAAQRIRYTIEDMLNGKNGEESDHMEFNEAYIQMKRGAKVKLPEWGGYWYWSVEKQSIIMHLKDNTEIDIRESDNMGFTMDNICRTDWIEVN